VTQMAPEAPAAPAAPAAPSRGQGSAEHNPLKRKIGPLPTWVWVIIVAAALLGWSLYRSRTSSASPGTDTTGDTTDASQVPQFVNQTFVQPGPPSAPAPAPTGTPAPAPQGIKTLTVGRAMTLQQFAKEHHWTDVTLAAVETMNNLKPGAKLKKGQKIKRPWAPVQPGQAASPGG
jgi:hypothetical protein